MTNRASKKLLLVLELLYNSNIKSMNYIKKYNLNNVKINITNKQVIPYGIKSNILCTNY